VIKSFRSRALERFASEGDGSRLPVPDKERVRRILLALDAASAPGQLNIPGFKLHALKGKGKRFAVSANANYRITFGWSGVDAIDVDRGGLPLMTRNKLTGLRPMHPGELLREEVLPALGRPKTEIAAMLGVSRQTLYDILAERQPVTPPMALRFGKLLGNGPELWLNMQCAYDLDIAEQGMKAEVARIPTLQGAS